MTIKHTIKDTLANWVWWREMAAITFGCIMIAAGFVFFITPYKIVPGGVYGLGIVMHQLFPSIQVGTFGYMFDIPLLLTAIMLFGKQFGGRTLFAACITPGLMNIISAAAYPTREALQALDPSLLLNGAIDLSQHLMLACILGGTIMGAGLGLVVRNNATSGGTDIVAMILNRYLHIRFSRGVLLADSCVILTGLIVIGFGIGSDGNAEGGWLLSLYSLICIFVASRVIDYVIDGASYDKLLFIQQRPLGAIARIHHTRHGPQRHISEGLGHVQQGRQGDDILGGEPPRGGAGAAQDQGDRSARIPRGDRRLRHIRRGIQAVPRQGDHPRRLTLTRFER